MKRELRKRLSFNVEALLFQVYRFFKIQAIFYIERLTLIDICVTIIKIFISIGCVMTDLELTKKIFEHDGFVKLTGLKIVEATEERAVVEVNITDAHRNASGSVQGGMLYSIADFAFAVLANYKHPLTVTQVGQISYIKAAYTDKVRAIATERVHVGHNCVSEVVIEDDKGETVCICSFNGFVKNTDKEELKKKYQ